MTLIEALKDEADALYRKGLTEMDPIKREIIFAEWSGMCRALFLAKHPDRLGEK